jgi:hypothetical protein
MTTDARPTLNDRERILTELVRRLASALLSSGKRDDGRNVHLDWMARMEDRLKPGDLVLCLTSGTHDWTVAWLVRRVEYARFILRELGGERECDMGNEDVAVFRNIDPMALLEGEEYRLLVKVREAFGLARETEKWGFVHLFNRLKVFGRQAHVEVGERLSGRRYHVSFWWTPEMTAEDVLEAMKKAGYGTLEFVNE